MKFSEFIKLLNESFDNSSIAVEFSIRDKQIYVRRGQVEKTFLDWANTYKQEFMEVVEAMKKKWPDVQFLKKDSQGLETIPDMKLIQAYIIKYFYKNEMPFDIIAALGNNSDLDQINIEI